MPHSAAKQKQSWTPQEEAELKRLIEQKKRTYDIATNLGRTEGAVRAKARRLRLSLEPQDELPNTEGTQTPQPTKQDEQQSQPEEKKPSKSFWKELLNPRGRTSSSGADAAVPEGDDDDEEEEEDDSGECAAGEYDRDDSAGHGESGAGSQGEGGPGGGAWG
jgi:hypothetical protein